MSGKLRIVSAYCSDLKHTIRVSEIDEEIAEALAVKAGQVNFDFDEQGKLAWAIIPRDWDEKDPRIAELIASQHEDTK